MTWLFHGTLAESVEAIDREGIRLVEGEPSFTADVALACCKYAHRGYNTKLRYSGKTLLEAHELVSSGVLSPEHSPGELLCAARTWWEGHDDGGRVFGILANRWSPCPSPLAVLRIDSMRGEVRGGLTKWIEDHLCVEPAEDPTRPIPTGIPPSHIKFTIACTPSLRCVLRRMTGGPEGGFPSPELHSEMCTVLAGELRLHEAIYSCRANELASEIVVQTRAAAIGSALRRGYLSILRTAGYSMIKADFVNPYEEDDHVFWPRDDVAARLVELKTMSSRFREEYEPYEAAIEGLGRLFLSGVPDEMVVEVLHHVDSARGHSWLAH